VPVPDDYSFTRYLAAKKTVDDRALNAHVWETLRDHLPKGGPPVRVLEVGAGIGTMVERVLERQLFARAAYTALDAQPDNVATARARLMARADGHGFHASDRDGILTLVGPAVQFSVELLAADLLAFADRPAQRGAWDVLIAHAVLDLLDLPSAVPALLGLLRPGGLFYFTVNFDGATILQPDIDPAFDTQIEALYHRTMDERLTAGCPSGDSRAGRHLFEALRQARAEILAAGASDWVVYSGREDYVGDEAYFLHFIIHTLQEALRGHPGLEAARFERWIAERHAQIERGELVYIAHQLDFVGRAPGRAGT
jgi:SAM-dependent methyltransferase